MIALCYGLGLIGILAAQLPAPYKLVLLLAIGSSCLWSYLRYGQGRYRLMPNGSRPMTLKVFADATAVVADGSEEELLVNIHPSSTLFSWLIVLHVRGKNYRETFFFSRDNLRGQQFRRLKIILGWASRPQG